MQKKTIIAPLTLVKANSDGTFCGKMTNVTATAMAAKRTRMASSTQYLRISRHHGTVTFRERPLTRCVEYPVYVGRIHQ